MIWSHVGLNCRDIDATARFYTTYFGFRTARTVPLGDTRIVFLRNGDAYLELFDGERGGPAAVDDGPKQIGTVRHLAFQTDDVDGFLRDLDPSVPVTLGPMDFDAFIPGWRTVWVSDPDGVVVEISQGYRDEEDATDGQRP
jgi:glyoxylase I family protein